MYELKTNTAVRIAVGPLVDPDDGKTAETALDVTALSVQLYQIKNDGNAVVRTQFAPTASGGNNDMILVSSSTDGMYDLELTAAQLNWLGNGRICFYDVDGFLVHWIDILVVSSNYFDWKYGTGNVNSDVIAISGDTAAADNCESMFDGTGYAGGTAKLGVDVVNWKGSAAPAMTGDAFARLGAPAGASVSADIADIHTDIGTVDGKIDALNDFDPANDIVAHVTLVDTCTENTDMVAAADIADAVWNESIADHLGAGTTGNALNAAGSAGDPWSTLLPGEYGAGTAGKIVGDNLNAPVGTIDTVVDGIATAIGNLNDFDPANDTVAHVTLVDTCTANTDMVSAAPSAADIKTAMEAAGSHLALILEDTGTTLPSTLGTIAGYIDTEIGTIITHLTDIKGATFSGATDSLEAIRNQGDSAWITATGFSTHSAADVAALILATPAQKLVTDESGYVTANMNGDFTATQKSSITSAVPTTAQIKTAMEAAGSHLALILEDTGTTLDTLIKDIPTTAEFEARTLAAADYTVVADLGTVQTGDSFAIVNGDHGLVSIQDDIDAIKAKTDNLPSGISKNTALANFEFLMVLTSDHVTPATGKTVTATRSIDGAAFGACANAVSEVGSGIYKINLAAADLNGDVITLKFSEATCDTRFITIVTEPA